MNRPRHTKIVATLGPASSSAEAIQALYEAGVRVFRLNFSHGTHEDHRRRAAAIREIEDSYNDPVSILADLQGPKLRFGNFVNGGVELKAGDSFRIDLSDEPGNESRGPLPHSEIFEAISMGTEILIDDGKVRLSVESVSEDHAITRVLVGGRVSNHKGVNLPNAILPIPILTEKDREDLEAGLDLGADWVALSFVQQPEDVVEARDLIAGRAAIMVKVEKPSAVDRFDEIVDAFDGIMVARGDLGVELPPERVPIAQKNIIQACRQRGKPVIVATQMLDSMVHAPIPTRAEASDVATAVYEGADAVMLSAESAAGDYPVEAVAMMARIIDSVEDDPRYRDLLDAGHPEPERIGSDAITSAACRVARSLGASTVVTYTTSGSTALRAARERPDVPIMGLTPERKTARRLALSWGVVPVHTEDVSSVDEMVDKACAITSSRKLAKATEQIVITAGMPFGTPGTTNLLRLARISEACSP